MKAERLDADRWPDLVFGLVGPVGTDLSKTSDILHCELNKYGYRAEKIRLSRLIGEVFEYQETTDKYERTKALMNLGDRLRAQTGQNDAAALLATSKIMQLRRPMRRNNGDAYILHSLKHPEEIETLRRVYGSAFFLISCNSSRPFRVNAIARQIAQSKCKMRRDEFRTLAEELIDRDEKDPAGKSYGQNTRDAFPYGDVFVDTEGNIPALEKQLQRFLKGVFGYQFLTPRIEEHCMFHAHSVALRSSDLARQVGAVIASSQGDLISAGCNEAPKAGGGQYWENDTDRYRDVELGCDSNQIHKDEIVRELLSALKQNGKLASDITNWSFLQGTRLKGILEFGRSVHAEMAALMDAARRGVPVVGGTMYTTTFPCHLCARHIIASGISRVVYIEPYPKSLTKELYGDSVAMYGENSSRRQVEFKPFFGFSPSRYFELFTMLGDSRKDKYGKIRPWKKQPIARQYSRAHIGHEIRVCEYLIKKLSAKRLGCPNWLKSEDGKLIQDLPAPLRDLVACPNRKLQDV